MSIKLRDLIRSVRGCKTAAEERAVIAKESALIRTAFKDQDNQYRHRNVAKLLFIHMLGYPSHFGQMECLKLIASPHFPEKRIGYLGLMLLLTDQEEVLTLVTNCMKRDLDLVYSSQFVVGLSLTAVGNIASPDMARDLAIDIDKHLRGDSEYLRKKAALAAIRIFKKVPDLIEDYIEQIVNLLKDRSHGVLVAGIQLLIEVILLNKDVVEKIAKYVPDLVRLLRNLLSMGYAPDHDVAGIADPFLQVKILQLLRYLGKNNADASDAMNDILAQVATNTETAKNAGNAILYECVQTIMSIESESGLRVLAVNILGRFLLNRDNNIRYVALNTLSKVVADDVAAVQRHRNTIVECLKDPDVSIRQRSLELIYALVNESNIRTLAREMLNYLVVAPPEHKTTLCSKIADAVDRYAPTRRWHVDTLITMLSIAGSNLPDERISCSLIVLIQQAPDIHSYVVHKLYYALKEDLSQIALVHVGVWCIGEYGEELMRSPPEVEETLQGKKPVEEGCIADLLKQILYLHRATDVTKAFVLNAMIKLTTRFTSQDHIATLTKLISTFKASKALELQQRSCEYSSLLDPQWSGIRKDLFLKMPVIDPAIVQGRRKKLNSGSIDGSEGEGEKVGQHSPTEKSKSTFKHQSSLLDLDDIFSGGGGDSTVSKPAPVVKSSSMGSSTSSTSNTVDLLSDIFSQPLSQQTILPAAPVQNSSGNHDDLMGLMGFGTSSGSSPPAAVPKKQTINAYDKDGLLIMLELEKPNAVDPSTSHILAIFTNSSSAPITNFVFQTAFPKYVKLQMDPPSSGTIPPNNEGKVSQMIKVQNSMQGEKPLMMKMKIEFVQNGNSTSTMGTVSSFPSGY